MFGDGTGSQSNSLDPLVDNQPLGYYNPAAAPPTDWGGHLLTPLGSMAAAMAEALAPG